MYAMLRCLIGKLQYVCLNEEMRQWEEEERKLTSAYLGCGIAVAFEESMQEAGMQYFLASSAEHCCALP